MTVIALPGRCMEYALKWVTWISARGCTLLSYLYVCSLQDLSNRPICRPLWFFRSNHKSSPRLLPRVLGELYGKFLLPQCFPSLFRGVDRLPMSCGFSSIRNGESGTVGSAAEMTDRGTGASWFSTDESTDGAILIFITWWRQCDFNW